ncbi:3-keto-disaccharide hydrolase [Echinicola salinicaeni]|uniref:3-keto-disaccharide hydrolase n=1 Tax=Echinicola salinicaeni TaxID=2762757 RepID=UPI001645D508|nr:DUF1080 domain-containing protein [Echinicola salinicaeni]
MKKTLLSLSALAMLATTACGSGQSDKSTSNTEEKVKVENSSDKKSEGDWTVLFDGSNTDSWKTYNKATIGEAWKTKDGVLYLDSSVKEGRGDLVTKDEYSNFHLKLDWKISDNGNSGIMFMVHEDEQFRHPYVTGPEYQLLDDEGHPDGKNLKHRTADLYDMIQATEEASNPVGEWNSTEIIVNDGKLTFKLNGITTVETTMWDESWKALIAGSKFKNAEHFGIYKKGKIALQDHGNDVFFKNIMIKEL